jgi:hypothetical protein
MTPEPPPLTYPPAALIETGDVIEVQHFHLNAVVTHRDSETTPGMVVLDWEPVGDADPAIGVSALEAGVLVHRLIHHGRAA